MECIMPLRCYNHKSISVRWGGGVSTQQLYCRNGNVYETKFTPIQATNFRWQGFFTECRNIALVSYQVHN